MKIHLKVAFSQSGIRWIVLSFAQPICLSWKSLSLTHWVFLQSHNSCYFSWLVYWVNSDTQQNILLYPYFAVYIKCAKYQW